MNFINNDDLDSFVLLNIKNNKEKKEKEKKKDYNYKKCIDCDKYYGYNTDNRCSLCHIISNKDHPDNYKYYKDKNGIVKSIFNKRYSLTYLHP